MPIVTPTFKNDSENHVISAARFSALGVAVANGDYSTDYSDDTVFFFAKSNFSKIALEFNNTGAGSIDYQISGKTGLPDPDVAADTTWEAIKDGEDVLDSKGNKNIFINDAYSYLLIRFKESAAGTSSVLNLHLRAIN